MAIIGNGITTGAAGLDGMITVSDTQPTLPSNKVWVKETPGEIEIPTVDELEELKGEFESTVDYTESYNTVSGDIVSFDDGVAGKSLHKLLGTIEPVQDLHGQDAPYPAGGGKNKFNVSEATSQYFSISGETFINTHADSLTKFFLSWQIFNGNTLVTYNVKEAATTGRMYCTVTINDPCTRMVIKHNGSNADLTINCPWTRTGTWTISMDVVSNNPSVIDGLVLSNIQIESGSTATDWTPYANICPISGHTGVEVTRAGKNLWNPDISSDKRTIDKLEIVNQVSGYMVYAIPLHAPNIQFRVSAQQLASGTSAVLITSNKNAPNTYGDAIAITELGWAHDKVLTSDANGCLYFATNTTPERTISAVDASNVQIEKGSQEATSFVSYAGEVTPISWQSKAGTIYGGSIDVASGKLIATHGFVDLGTLTWYYFQNSRTAPHFGANVSGIKRETNYILCSNYATVKDNPYDNAYGTIRASSEHSASGIKISDAAYTDAASFKTAMSGVQLAYELATPVEYNLSSRAIKTLSGQNNIWIDTGSITECEYVTATSSVIDKLLPEATDEDVGKALLVKTVEDGRVTEYELGDVKEDLSNLAHVIIDTASGDIATFTDGADNQPIQKLVATIEPVQDLHGYENPWPGGGSKNKFDSTTVNTGAYLDELGNVVAASAWCYSDYIETGASQSVAISGYVNAGSAPCACWYDDNKGFVSSFHLSATSTIVTSPENAKYLRISVQPAYVEATQVELGSTVTDYVPYANICPISGHTGLTVARTGVNVWDEEMEVGMINNDGTNGTDAERLRIKNYIKVLPGSTYYASLPSNNVLFPFYYDKFKNFVMSAPNVSGVFTIPNNCEFVRFHLQRSYGTTYNHDISINYPSTDTEYHAYTGATVPITWETEAGTVYGGTLDVVSGKMTVDKKIKTITSADVYGGISENQYGKLVTIASASDSVSKNSGKIFLYNYFKFNVNVAMDNLPLWNIGSWSGVTYLQQLCVPALFASLQEVKDWIDACDPPIQCAYPLATPIEYTLTANELTTLYGTNNIWTDVGEVSVNYPADTKLYIDKKISEAVAALSS